jgi:hypothetical protein
MVIEVAMYEAVELAPGNHKHFVFVWTAVRLTRLGNEGRMVEFAIKPLYDPTSKERTGCHVLPHRQLPEFFKSVGRQAYRVHLSRILRPPTARHIMGVHVPATLRGLCFSGKDIRDVLVTGHNHTS